MVKKIIAGNWKMNKLFSEADDFFDSIVEYVADIDSFNNTEIIVCPPTIYLELATDYTINLPIAIGAQNASQYAFGAYTGEISPQMLSNMGVKFCIVGHSERRQYFAESDKIVNMKLKNIQSADIIPIFCVGESLDERENGDMEKVILNQLKVGLQDVKINDNLYIAYEPIWAIGTGKTATAKQAQEVHLLIRNWLRKNYGEKIAEQTPILYGGSVKPENIEELLAKPDINGGLIGGASLDESKFSQIIEKAINISK